MISVFFLLTYFTLYDGHQVHSCLLDIFTVILAQYFKAIFKYSSPDFLLLTWSSFPFSRNQHTPHLS